MMELDYYALGVLVGILVAVLLVIVLRLVKEKSAEYDERQIALRNQAYQRGFFAMLFAIAVNGMTNLVGFHWCVEPLGQFTAAFIGIAVFACSAILKDAYFGLRQKKKSLMVLFVACSVLQLVNFISDEDAVLFENGAMTLRWLPLMTAVLFLTVLLTLVIHSLKEKQEDEE